MYFDPLHSSDSLPFMLMPHYYSIIVSIIIFFILLGLDSAYE
jgi:hypothetical protein